MRQLYAGLGQLIRTISSNSRPVNCPKGP